MAPEKRSKTAEDRVAEAQAALRAAQEELVESQGELRARVTRDVPQMVCEVMPDAHVVHEGKSYHGADYGKEYGPRGDRLLHGKDHGTEVTLDGPTAIALVMDGKVRILRST